MRDDHSFWEWTIRPGEGHTAAVRNRREIWREFMGCFEPSSDPRDAVQRGFYVPRPGRTLAEQLAARFEVKPSASHLLVGGVGSGKTTQLLVAQERLKAHGDVAVAYVDVSLHLDPNQVRPTGFVAAIGLELGKTILDAKRSDLTAERMASLGNFLDPEAPPWANDPLDEFLGYLKDFIQELAPGTTDRILFIDSLDRMSDVIRFSDLVNVAIPKCRAIGIGIVLVGPLTALYGIHRTVLDRFDRVWHLSSVDVDDGVGGRQFLRSVLDKRDKTGLLLPESSERLVALSGGVMRDLIALTQSAGGEAYLDDAEQIELRHVEIAADQFGRKQLFAIDSEQLSVLQRVRKSGTFVQTSEKDLALLATRRVLEYTDGKPRFAVHPTIEPLLAQIAGEP